MKLLGINGNKTPRPDSIHPFMIKCLAELLRGKSPLNTLEN